MRKKSSERVVDDRKTTPQRKKKSPGLSRYVKKGQAQSEMVVSKLNDESADQPYNFEPSRNLSLSRGRDSSIPAEIDIIGVFERECKLEMEVEKLRQKLLSDSDDFNTVDAFRFLDTKGSGQVTPLALMQGLKALGIDFEQDDIILFFQKYVRDDSKMLKYSEFCDAVAPKAELMLKELASRVPRNIRLEFTYEQIFAEVTRANFKALWEELFYCERQTERLRQQLLKNPFFDIQKAFKALDVRNLGYIQMRDVS